MPEGETKAEGMLHKDLHLAVKGSACIKGSGFGKVTKNTEAPSHGKA